MTENMAKKIPHLDPAVDKDRTDLIIMGRNLGTYEGWDEIETGCMQFDGFVARVPSTIPSCQTLQFDFNKGTLEGFGGPTDDHVAELLFRMDIISCIGSIEVSDEAERGELVYPKSASPFDLAKPHKGKIVNWSKIRNPQQGFWITGFQEPYESGKPGQGCGISTSDVLLMIQQGHNYEIETRNSRYTLIGRERT